VYIVFNCEKKTYNYELENELLTENQARMSAMMCWSLSHSASVIKKCFKVVKNIFMKATK